MQLTTTDKKIIEKLLRNNRAKLAKETSDNMKSYFRGKIDAYETILGL